MRRILILAALALLAAAPAAQAASIAYIDNGGVWLSSLDGTVRTRLAVPVGVEKWVDVAQSDNGRIVAVRNEPGKISSLSKFKVWEPDGTSTVEGPLNAPSGWATYTYPLGFDVTPDGRTMVYGFSNSSLCCPIGFGRGTYVRPVTNSVLAPIVINGQENPSLFGTRVVARSGSALTVQSAAATTYGTDFAPWADTSGVGLELSESDVAATGTLAAAEFEQWNGGTQVVGKIAVFGTAGVDAPPTFTVDCFLPASGVASEPSLSPDATRIAWTDAGGLRVAGTPVDASDPCVLGAAPVTISPTGSHGSIGGANVSAFLPPASPPIVLPPTTTAPPPTTTTTTTTPAAPTTTIAATVKLKATGLSVPVTVSGAGPVTVTATVPAKAMGKKGKPVTIGSGSAAASKAGSVTVKLKLTGAAKKRLKKLKGVKLTLTITQNGAKVTRTVKVR